MLHRPEGTFNHDLAEFLDWKAPANTISVNGVYSFEEASPIRRLVVYQRRSHACSMIEGGIPDLHLEGQSDKKTGGTVIEGEKNDCRGLRKSGLCMLSMPMAENYLG
ncbi:hypothetical protein ACET3Z_005632 [Daucus carota]